ncbi:MAG: sugar phosphate isomerase/epimerase [Clostridia bacterium]|nr:sugar phosphate isomerase/epimerase [Clostridia bacterium]
MKLGCMVHMDGRLKTGDIGEQFARLKEMGIPTCQLNCWKTELFTDEAAEEICRAREQYGIEISALWCGWAGPCYWNFYEGQSTLGLVPVAYRYDRMKELMKGADFAQKLGVTDVITHCGYLPENPCTAEFADLVACLKTLVKYFASKGCNFLFETGQETPVTLLRTIQEIGMENVGINLDPANLILYGKANPVDALDVFGKYVRNVHGKDGLYPTDGRSLGKEVAMGEGKVNYPAFIKRLAEIGYEGPITIEREIVGEQQTKDIKMACELLLKLFAENNAL